MKLTIFSTDKKKAGEREVPHQFQEEYRPDLIKRVVQALQRAARQAYGSDPEAGFRHSVRISKRRKHYKTSYGHGISRIARKIHSHRGTRFNWVAAQNPQAVGGRRTHPPKAERIWEQKVNIKERRKAIRSAMAATLNKETVLKRGHHIPTEYPFIVDKAIESMTKTKDVREVLHALGFADELVRTEYHKVRSGIGKMRGRKYKSKKGVLIVVGGDCPLVRSASNIRGIDIVRAQELNAELLAPGSQPGRATVWTTHAVDVVEKEQLFI